MFDNLRAAFREAIDNFQRELDRDAVPETVDKLLKGMVDELTQAKARIAELEEQVARADREAEAEKEQAMTALRRGQMAQEIGDEETAALADKFAEKHARRQMLLEQKSEAFQEELAFLRTEVDEMMAKVKEARASRDSLAATAKRTGARETFGEADDLFRELDRMAEKIGDEEAMGEAARSFSEEEIFDDPVDSGPPPPRPEEVDYDAALAELKRRMGKQG